MSVNAGTPMAHRMDNPWTPFAERTDLPEHATASLPLSISWILKHPDQLVLEHRAVGYPRRGVDPATFHEVDDPREILGARVPAG